MEQERASSYLTITGRKIPFSKLSDAERKFLSLVGKEFGSRPEWTRFAAWWNRKIAEARIGPRSLAFRICQDLEARLGIEQGKLSPPDYRDFLADLIDARYGSRQEFCQKFGVDPGQLSRVFAGRADLSIKALQKLLEALQVHLVVQTDEDARAQSSVKEAESLLALSAR